MRALGTLRKVPVAVLALGAAWTIWALAASEETRFFEYDERKGDIHLTGRIYFLEDGELAVEAWPRPRSKKVKVTKIVVTSPSGKTYKPSRLRTVPMSQLPSLRSSYVKVTRTPFAKEAYAYEDKQGSGSDRTEGEASDQKATVAMSLLSGLARSAMTGPGDKERVSVGDIKTKPELGQWKLSVMVEDDRGRKENFYIPFAFPADILGPPKGPEPEPVPVETPSSAQPPPTNISTPKFAKICGPDATDALVESLNRIRIRMAELGPEEKGDWDEFWFMWRNGIRMDIEFSPVGPCPTNCPGTVTLCDVCVYSKATNNILYGWTGHELGVGLAMGFGGNIHEKIKPGTSVWDPDPPEAQAAYALGWGLALLGRPITREDVCRLLHEGEAEITYAFTAGHRRKIVDFLTKFSVGCKPCPDAAEPRYDFSTADWWLSDLVEQSYNCGYQELDRESEPKVVGKETRDETEHFNDRCSICKKYLGSRRITTVEITTYRQRGFYCSLPKNHSDGHRLVVTELSWTSRKVLGTRYDGSRMHPCLER